MTDNVPITSTPAPPRSTPRFPPEIPDLIIAKADRSQLPTIIRISKSFYHSSSYRLYNSLSVQVHCIDAHDPCSCIAEAGKLERCLETTCAGMEGAVQLSMYWLRILASPTFPSILPGIFTYITRLCIGFHGPEVCAGIGQVPMPNLDTLQLFPPYETEPGQSLDLCHPSHSHPLLHNQPIHSDHPTCPLVLNLQPRQVIIGGTLSSLIGDGAGLWTSDSHFPPPWLGELVIIIGSTPVSIGHSFLDHLPATIERLTLVFQPDEYDGEDKWVPKDGQRRADLDDDSDEDEEDWEYRHTCAILADMCMSSVGVVEVVGWETVDTAWTGMTADDGVEELRERMVSRGKRRGWSMENAERKAEDVMFLGRADWEDRERQRQSAAAKTARQKRGLEE